MYMDCLQALQIWSFLPVSFSGTPTTNKIVLLDDSIVYLISVNDTAVDATSELGRALFAGLTRCRLIANPLEVP